MPHAVVLWCVGYTIVEALITNGLACLHDCRSFEQLKFLNEWVLLQTN